MKVLLDTHIFLWAVAEPEKLSKRQVEFLERPSNILYVSAVTIAEIMIKNSIGKLQIAFDPVEIAKESGFELLEFSAEDARILGEFPYHHRDPFDRMLIAQAMQRNLPIMSDDGKFASYDCKLCCH
ncbi:type II toxin-antitoxin system VapC family toxin [Hydrogenimonas sp. SS33]|uniref:type II toxin-antitoxin system VapC family toxin n=1 Tax=Hydrogenimonas leucolamina TaxID=2954236 RepID=UPI00336BAF28